MPSNQLIFHKQYPSLHETSFGRMYYGRMENALGSPTFRKLKRKVNLDRHFASFSPRHKEALRQRDRRSISRMAPITGYAFSRAAR